MLFEQFSDDVVWATLLRCGSGASWFPSSEREMYLFDLYLRGMFCKGRSVTETVDGIVALRSWKGES